MSAALIGFALDPGSTKAQAPSSSGAASHAAGKAEPAAADAQQGAVPADHYDPDDAKTFADVSSEDRVVTIRGQQFTLHLYWPRTGGPAVPAIYASGDGGWRGLAPRTAQQLAHMGFAVAGLDSKAYLRRFSSIADPLTVRQLARDYADIAQVARDCARVEAHAPVYVYGWSLGAGFAVAVGADAETRGNWAGIISIGLPAQNQLVSGVNGKGIDLTAPSNARYGFRTEKLIAAVAPLPLVMIQSTSDGASPPKVGRMLFETARDPKQYVLIKASNHRFSGARDEFYAALGNAMTWIKQARAAGASPEREGAIRLVLTAGKPGGPKQ